MSLAIARLFLYIEILIDIACFFMYNQFMAIYFFYGDEDYLIDEEIKKYRNKLDKNFASMNFKVYDNPNFAELVNVLSMQPMMFGKMMNVINIDKILSSTFEDNQLKMIEECLNSNNENLDIFFVAKYPRNEGKKPDSRRKIYKIISKYDTKEFPSIKTYKTVELTAWITKEAKKHGITFEKNAANILIEHIGNNLRELAIEIEKLALLAYPNKTITKTMVNDICISNQDIFCFTEYIMNGQKGKALLELRRLMLKEYPLKLLATTQTMLRKWIQIKLKCNELSLHELSIVVKMNEFQLEKTISKLKNVQLKDLIQIREYLTDAEYNIKMGISLNVEDEVENAVIR